MPVALCCVTSHSTGHLNSEMAWSLFIKISGTSFIKISGMDGGLFDGLYL